MPRRRKFEPLIKDLWRRLRVPREAEWDFALSLGVWNLLDFTKELTRDVIKVRQLLELTRALRVSDATGRQVAEERLMENLGHWARKCGDRIEAGGSQRKPALPVAEQLTPGQRPLWLVLRELHDFALACFAFKRPRDSFGGRRRALALNILSCVGTVVDLPEVLELARGRCARNGRPKPDRRPRFWNRSSVSAICPPTTL